MNIYRTSAMCLLMAAGNVLYAGGDITPAPVVVDETLWDVSASVGTLGVGGNIAYYLNKKFDIRFNVNGFKLNRHSTISDIDYDVDARWLTAGALLDYHPFEGHFRLSAGLYYNGNKADGTARYTSTESFELGDHTYTGAEIGQVDAKVDFDHAAPYLGIGYDSISEKSHWGYTFDLGVLYQGSPHVSAVAHPNPTLPQAMKDQIAQDIEKERQDIENDVHKYRFYPVVSVGVKYTF